MAGSRYPLIAEVSEPVKVPPKPKFELLVQVLTLIFSATAAFTAYEINNRLKKLDSDVKPKDRIKSNDNYSHLPSQAQEDYIG